MAFIQRYVDEYNVYYIGLKTVDWSATNGLRPENPTAIAEMDGANALEVYPNPFSAGFTISLPEGNKEANYNLQLFNLLGQVIYQTQGNLEDLNAGLGSIGQAIPSGSYWLLLNTNDGTYCKQVVRW